MPYSVRDTGERFEIVRKSDGKVVGSSGTKEQAERSIGYRIKAELEKDKK